ncbi:MAG: type II toxin-antitoxin system mRNA interferase toxin, RelE/StbE family [Patescibacteria group bacterium]
MEATFSPSFIRTYKKLPLSLKNEIKEKISLFCNEENHKMLKVHKLSGKLKEQYSFNVNYKTRIVFYYSRKKPKEAFFVAIGDHDIYD